MEPSLYLYSGVDLNFKLEEVSLEKKMKIIKILNKMSQRETAKKFQILKYAYHQKKHTEVDKVLAMKKTGRHSKLRKRNQRKLVRLCIQPQISSSSIMAESVITTEVSAFSKFTARKVKKNYKIIKL